MNGGARPSVNTCGISEWAKRIWVMITCVKGGAWALWGPWATWMNSRDMNDGPWFHSFFFCVTDTTPSSLFETGKGRFWYLKRSTWTFQVTHEAVILGGWSFGWRSTKFKVFPFSWLSLCVPAPKKLWHLEGRGVRAVAARHGGLWSLPQFRP